jgi:hypothetical protein
MSPTKTRTRTPAKKTAPKASGVVRSMSDDAVLKATGKTWKEWFAELDRAGGKELDHRGIVALAGVGGAGPWWQQMVTVEYERARGLRAKHERPDGYSVSKSVTLGVPVDDAFGWWNDAKTRAKWLGKGLTVRKANANKSMRITWCDQRTSVEVNFWRKGPEKCQVAVQHSKLADAGEAAKMKAYWGMKLEQMAKRLV